MRVCEIEDRTFVVVVASYRSVSRNPVRFKALSYNINMAFAGFLSRHLGVLLVYHFNFHIQQYFFGGTRLLFNSISCNVFQNIKFLMQVRL